MKKTIKEKATNAIRILSIDAIENAKSGHPGLPLGMAAIAYELWGYHMKHNPQNPNWINRDRFVLSGGHGSMLLYSLLHLFGYPEMSLDEIKAFRQLGSKTPGHPEYGMTSGVETTTGPLGAGFATAVGMAVAETKLAKIFNKNGFNIIDHYTFVFAGDGCLMEGITNEAASLAGAWKLDKLIVLYDCNHITIEGSTDLAFRENVQMKYEALGFQVLKVDDGNNFEQIAKAIELAKAERERPSLIIFETTIGYGCPEKQGKSKAHGDPLGERNVRETRWNLKWEYETPFYIPNEIYEHYLKLAHKGQIEEENWNLLFEEYRHMYPEEYLLLRKYYDGFSIESLWDNDQYWENISNKEATRTSCGRAINVIKEVIPNLIGGAADVASSTRTYLINENAYSADNRSGRNFHFGVREMAMAAIGNGIMLHGGFRSFVSCFLIFSDFMKPMIRLSALMKVPLLYIFTHDSIGVGEDGPTHQPIEQCATLREIPNLITFRPADNRETLAGVYYAISQKKFPVALILSRQDLPQIEKSSKNAIKGGYILIDSKKEVPDLIIIATGSELKLAVEAQKKLYNLKIDVRVVSMPSPDLFEMQTNEYKESILPIQVRNRIAIEAASTSFWYKYVGLDGAVIGIDSFGESAPGEILFEHFGFTVQNIVNVSRRVLEQNS